MYFCATMALVRKSPTDVVDQVDQHFGYIASTWVVPVILAITLHEAAHGFVAHWFGDDTAWRLGRVSLNPLKHIDPFGTILLPALLLLTHAPSLFGYAKPVPVKFSALHNPRSNMVWVAAAGPATNLLQATAAGLLVHIVGLLPAGADQWFLQNLENAIVINAILAVFNMLPLPPLDGGRVAIGLLPNALALPLARLERYGMLIMIGLIFVLPMLGAQLGVNLNVLGWLVSRPTSTVVETVLRLTGNT
jgi:Zn-dependent protease